MSLPVAIQSAIFYYLACTPCNEMKAFRKAKKKAKEEREVKRRIEMEQPGLYRHPDPFNTNPYWAEEMAMGPHLPKKSATKNSSQRGLASAGRTSTAASFGNASTAADSCSPVSPTISAEKARRTSGDGWNRTLYQREDEELWGHNLSGMGHKLMDNIVKAGNTAGRYVEEKLGREKNVTDEDRENFYTTPRNPPVNEYHPPIVGSKPSRPDALKWMLQPPPPAKLMEGRVPVTRTQSTSTVGSRRTMASEEPPLDRLVRQKALEKKLRRHGDKSREETPSESELIDSLIGSRTRSRKSTVSSKGGVNRSRSLSLESEVSSDGELVERRRRARARRIPITPEETSSDEDDYMQQRTWDSLGRASPPRRPKLETISSSRSNRQALKARPNGTKPDAAPKDTSDITPKASANPIILKADENENIPTTPATVS